jgi:hypothetical protein
MCKPRELAGIGDSKNEHIFKGPWVGALGIGGKPAFSLSVSFEVHCFLG